MPPTSEAGPLAGVRVLDLSIFLAGPFCTLLLGGLGAEVIKIESLGGDPGRGNPPYLGPNGIRFVGKTDADMSLSTLNRNRNKKCITLDLKHAKGQELFHELCRHSDVVVENFTPGVVDRLRASYAHVRAVNPEIIYCSVTGFGQTGPYRDKRGVDLVIQAMSGLMATTGFADGPPLRTSVPVGDLIAPLFAASGILAALHHRERTGVGQYLDVAMLDSLVALLAGESFDVFERLGLTFRTGNGIQREAPFGVFQTQDGHAAICAPNNAFAKRLFAVMDREELLSDPRFCDRGQRALNGEAINGIVGEWARSLTTAEILAKLEPEGVPVGPVLSPLQVVNDPHIQSRQAVVPLAAVVPGSPLPPVGMGMPIKFSETPCGFDMPAAWPGQHNAEILQGLLGLSAQRVSQLTEDGVIGPSTEDNLPPQGEKA